ncbi:hypothetical protein [Thalassobaculum sp.]|uniref:hypothetical protein n=1 Tax=Thalassobaculum sp. TaxID=2022740 RepID=UPI0032EDEAD7
MRWLYAIPLFLGLTACAEITPSTRLSKPAYVPLSAGVGDTVLEVDIFESMPNAFGKADLFGRTRPKGKNIVIYLGQEQGRAVFERQTIRMQSNATTMNSTPTVISQTSTTSYSGSTVVLGSGASGPFSGTAYSSGSMTTSAPPIILPPRGSQTQVISSDRLRYFIDVKNDPVLHIEGNAIVIDSASDTKLRYRIEPAGS